MQYLQFSQSLPQDVQVIREYLQANDIEKRRWMAEWNLATLAREIILNAQDIEPNQFLSSLKKWDYLADSINKLKTLEGKISQLYLNQTNILSELRRIFFLESPWQIQKPQSSMMFRYFSIYSDENIDFIVQNKYGLSIKDIYTIGMLLLRVYINNLIIYYPPQIEVEEINKEKLDKFLKYFAEDISNFKKIIANSNKIDENFLYQFNPLRYYPIIRCTNMGKEALICPIPTFLFWRLTGGVYYDLVKEKDFDNIYGKAFENYINEVLEKTNLRNLRIYRDEEYYPRPGIPKKTVDFIVSDNKELLFIECKAKRLSIDSQILIDINEKADKDYSILAEGIFQLYKTLDDYLNNLYTSCKYNNQSIYPLILTLENWFMSGHNDIGVNNLVKEKVINLFRENKLSLELLEKYPYSIMCIEEFEIAIQAMQQTSFKSFIETKILDKEKSTWPFYSYTNNYCKEHSVVIKELFDDNYIKKIFPENFTL